MKGEGYKTTSDADATSFQFESKGEKGIIHKKITYFHLGENIWNLGFGDDDGDEFDDEVISNNHDIRLVMQTIANTIYEFTEKHPERRIYIRPVDEKRKTLYNAVFKRRHTEIQLNFLVYGRIQNTMELFDPEKNYDAFFILRKKS